MDQYSIVAAMVLKHDARLSQKRFELVPDLLEEEKFWRSYFWQIKVFKHSQGIKDDEQLDVWEEASVESQEEVAPIQTVPKKQASAQDIEL